MNELEIFKNEEFGEVRVIEKDGEPWFVGKDVAEALGYSNPRKALNDHCKGCNETLLPTNGGIQSMKIINEYDVYRLVMRSKLPDAEKFQDWVMEEVLPSIRKNGGYLSKSVDFSDPDNVQKLLDAWKDDRKRLQKANETISIMKPKEDFYDAVTGSSDTIDMKEVSKILNISGLGRNKLFEVLRGGRILDKNNQPYQKYVDAGLFRLVESKYYVDGEARINTKTVVYQKGLAYIRKFLENNGYMKKEKYV